MLAHTPDRKSTTAAFAAFLMLAGLTIAGPAAADMTVIESDDPKIEVGKSYPDNATIDVAPGKTVKLVLPSAKTKVVKGEDDHASGKQSAPFGGTRGGEEPDE